MTGIITGFLLSSVEELIKGSAESLCFLFISKIQADLARLKSTEHRQPFILCLDLQHMQWKKFQMAFKSC